MLIVRPDQDIVTTMVPRFKQELTDLLVEDPNELRLDLAGVEMMDSIGIGLLIAIHNSMRKKGGSARDSERFLEYFQAVPIHAS